MNMIIVMSKNKAMRTQTKQLRHESESKWMRHTGWESLEIWAGFQQEKRKQLGNDTPDEVEHGE